MTAPQRVAPALVLQLRKASPKPSRGTRSDKLFFEISTTGSNDVPEAALRAYHRAEKSMATADPDCNISWTMLAAIGKVETNHGRFGGAQLGSDGVSRPEIRGPQLNGAGAFAAIHDSDNGTLDRDKVWDRAVGQMQFLPQTWSSVARDGDGNGTRNPDDIDDSALGSAVYLCGAGGSLATVEGMSRAAFRYNHSDYYVQLVLSLRPASRPACSPCPRRRPRRPRPRRRTKAKKLARRRKAAASPAPPKPKPKPTPSRPKPTPTRPPGRGRPATPWRLAEAGSPEWHNPRPRQRTRGDSLTPTRRRRTRAQRQELAGLIVACAGNAHGSEADRRDSLRRVRRCPLRQARPANAGVER